MVNITVVISREHEVVKAFEYQIAEELREVAEGMEGVPFRMYGADGQNARSRRHCREC